MIHAGCALLLRMTVTNVAGSAVCISSRGSFQPCSLLQDPVEMGLPAPGFCSQPGAPPSFLPLPLSPAPLQGPAGWPLPLSLSISLFCSIRCDAQPGACRPFAGSCRSSRGSVVDDVSQLWTASISWCCRHKCHELSGPDRQTSILLWFWERGSEMSPTGCRQAWASWQPHRRAGSLPLPVSGGCWPPSACGCLTHISASGETAFWGPDCPLSPLHVGPPRSPRTISPPRA